LDSEPNLNLASHIQDLIDGLFQILEDTNPEIKKICESLLGDFLKEISQQQFEKIKYETMVNIILVHCANVNDDSIQLTAMMWLKELTSLLEERALFFMPGILNVTLPCLSYSDENLKKNIKDQARAVNTVLWTLIDRMSAPENEISPLNSKTAGISNLAVDKVVESLTRLLVTPTDSITVLTTIGALRWLLHLINKQSETLLHVEDYFSILILFLSDPSKEVNLFLVYFRE
jgi:vacuole morphology and inheritance protein 14